MTSLCFEDSTVECIRKSWLCNGIYIFQCKETKDVLYIGSAPKQPLARRFSQHFSSTDTGATFFKNWKKEHPSRSFIDFQNVLGKCRIRLIYFEECKSKNTQKMVMELESALLHNLPENLQPKYNKEKPRKRKSNYISCESMNAAIHYINNTQTESV